jgi:hypothetical protein
MNLKITELELKSCKYCLKITENKNMICNFCKKYKKEFKSTEIKISRKTMINFIKREYLKHYEHNISEEKLRTDREILSTYLWLSEMRSMPLSMFNLDKKVSIPNIMKKLNDLTFEYQKFKTFREHTDFLLPLITIK